MKTRLWKIIFAVLLSLPLCANATTMDFYTDGTIVDGNNFERVNVWNTATVDMTGGRAFYCNLYDSSAFNFYDGDVGAFSTYQSAIVNVFAENNPAALYINEQSQAHLFNGRFFNDGMIFDDAELHIYGYNLEYHISAPDRVDGLWPDGRSFEFAIRNSSMGTLKDNVFLHEIPEPFTLCLLGLAGLSLRRC